MNEMEKLCMSKTGLRVRLSSTATIISVSQEETSTSLLDIRQVKPSAEKRMKLKRQVSTGKICYVETKDTMEPEFTETGARRSYGISFTNVTSASVSYLEQSECDAILVIVSGWTNDSKWRSRKRHTPTDYQLSKHALHPVIEII
nr:hypothetical protein Iba_chr10cCG3960 [Ipomoea batatas]